MRGDGKAIGTARALADLCNAADAIINESSEGIDQENPDQWTHAEITRAAIERLEKAMRNLAKMMGAKRK